MRCSLRSGDKRAISEVIAYVLLISVAIGLSVMVYNFLVHYVPNEEIEGCPEGVSLSLRRVYCNAADFEYNLSFEVRNSGLFSIDGYRVRVNDREGSRIGLYDFDGNGLVMFTNQRFKPGESRYFTIDYKDYVSGSMAKFSSNLKLLEVQPIYIEGGKTSYCNSVISELNCYPLFDITRLNGLIAYYPLTYNSSDLLGSGLDGNDYFVNYGGRSANFDGTSSYIDLGDNDFSYSEFSVSVWAKSVTNVVGQPGFPEHATNLVGEGNWNDDGTSGEGNWYIGYRSSPGNPVTHVGFNYGNFWTSGPSHSVGSYDLSVWNHFVGVANSSHQLLYLNGDVVSSVFIGHGTVDSLYNTQIGKSSYINHFFNGSINDVALFNRALTEREVKQIYSRGRSS